MSKDMASLRSWAAHQPPHMSSSGGTLDSSTPLIANKALFLSLSLLLLLLLLLLSSFASSKLITSRL